MTGDSDAANEPTGAAGDGKSEARRVPKAAGTAGAPCPRSSARRWTPTTAAWRKKLK